MQLYSFGSNGSGQLGLGHKDDVSQPTRCLFRPDPSIGKNDNANCPNSREKDLITHLAAGGNHTLVIYGSGAVYAAGSNGSGRCAHDAEELLEFTRVIIRDGERIVCRFAAVSATWESSCFVEKGTGHVYVAGVGMKGELGLGENVTEAKVPMRMVGFPPEGTKVVCLSGSVGHTVAVLSNGNVYGWGNARKGQLGEPGIKQKIYWSPQRIDVPFAIRQVACGREFTAFVGDQKDGSLLVLGSDKWGVQSAALLNLRGYRTVAASWHGIYSHNSSGRIMAWGRNDRGQLPPPEIPDTTSIGVGSEHVVAVIDKKEVIAFGWGEHGNCGPETDDQGNVAGRYAKVPFDHGAESVISVVGGGCATSWLTIE
ncbi:alpha tubulin suppressor [Ophidiomyces ophidiicola]|nr:alpha tubulin suppressor [Ophidiomyces ophidiicola]